MKRPRLESFLPRLVGAVNRCARTGEAQQMSPNERGGGRNLPVWASAAAAMTRLRRNKSEPARILSPSNAHILRRTVTHAARGRRKKVRGGGSVQNGGDGGGRGGQKRAQKQRCGRSGILRAAAPSSAAGKEQVPTSRQEKIIQTWEKRKCEDGKKNPVVSREPRLVGAERRTNTSSWKMSKDRTESRAAARCSPGLRASAPSASAASD